MNDVRKVIYGTIIGFFGMLALWFSIIYVSSCGLTFTCNRADPKVQRTPIPTLIPVSHSEEAMDTASVEFNQCQIAAGDLVGAWVSAGAPETDLFPFVDVKGQSCAGTFADVQPLFVENGVWKTGSLGCVSCHNADLTERSAELDMTTFAALSKSGILNNGTLIDYLGKALVPQGHSAEESAGNPIIYAGTITEAEATPTP